MDEVKTPGSVDADPVSTNMIQLTTPPSARSPSRFVLRKSSGSSSSSDSTGSPRKKTGFELPRIRGNRPQVPGVAQKTIVAEEKQSDGGYGNSFALFLVLSYIGVSILYYHFVENWSVVDCIYFAMVIVTTVGYGDVIPVKTAGKAFTIFFAFYGIATIGIALGRLANWFLSRQQEIAKQTTQRLLSHVDSAADSASITKGEDPVKTKENTVPVKTHHKPTHRRPRWVRALFSRSNRAIIGAMIPILISIGGGLILGAIEGWPILDCFYYAVITVTTVGFGDFSPKSEGGRIYAIFYLPLSVVSVAHGIGSIIEEIGKRKVMKSTISMKELLAMDSDGDGKVTKLEYLSYMLVKLGKADQSDIDGIIAQFHKLDKDGSGELDKEDLERLDRQLQQQQEQQDSVN
ncbi:hypothetical protein Poli38472_006868 [Pythium oligandrum]|uniref:EF-hand domain-containing protein n=1 Tax=Pythium oligandrum TaxID=41045 RepID=A0A8K1C5W0_PYTOL|nr:hypothetical protein Poli38472_006868 [Pythium oligandrum]|eukprot:TMW56858.1 hypothetical protein Poli38472_006868 [Pythium oligandrum]